MGLRLQTKKRNKIFTYSKYQCLIHSSINKDNAYTSWVVFSQSNMVCNWTFIIIVYGEDSVKWSDCVIVTVIKHDTTTNWHFITSVTPGLLNSLTNKLILLAICQDSQQHYTLFWVVIVVLLVLVVSVLVMMMMRRRMRMMTVMVITTIMKQSAISIAQQRFQFSV